MLVDEAQTAPEVFDAVQSRYLGKGRLHHLRSKHGAEIDFIVEIDGQAIPVEAKWTERPRRDDARHVIAFLREQKNPAEYGFVVCRAPRPELLHEGVMAIPWFCL
ncbi:MAG TPA: hypothetical protein VFG91_05100 [Woeseiaceae bacterium]|nr:hypothetical protein [Woeseiaceae bacterium]